MRFKRTKIVATIGPSSQDSKTLTSLIKAGVNVTRLNFSHGTHDEHAAFIKTIRAVAKKEAEPIAILQDLSGPKVRIGDFVEGSVTLVPGKRFILSTVKCPGTDEKVFIEYPYLHTEVKKGDSILLDDGRRKLTVEAVRGHEIQTKVVVGGTIRGRRGVNIPGAFKKISPITAKDRADLAFGLSQDVDFVALSFVRSAKDIEKLRALIDKHQPRSAPAIIAKIETREAVENMDAIIAASEGIMIARGDLAVEVSPENVPFIQKEIIRKCRLVGKPVITATQMLESMITSPVPTRAEVADVANAILDGTDAVMLSQETALGQFPLEAVTTMAEVARRTETHSTFSDLFSRTATDDTIEIVNALSRAIADTAQETNAKAIVALSESGFTAQMISRSRPTRPIIVLTPHKKTARRLSLSFACHSFITNPFGNLLEVVAESKRLLLREKLVAKGDHVVIAAGVPFGAVGSTNMLMVQTV